MNAPALSAQAQPLLQLDLEASALASNWKNCDRMANYMARLASFDRPDTFLYSNLCSTVLNELFEIVFCQHCSPGSVRCSLVRDQGLDRIELKIPANENERAFYAASVSAAQSAQVSESYTRLLLGEGEPDRSIGFLELAADYGAHIWFDSEPANSTVRLTVDVRLESNLPSPSADSK